jgi:hypothetical protein
VALEGLPGAGKSHVLKSAGSYGFPAIELDLCLPDPFRDDVPWAEAISKHGGVTAVQAAMSGPGLVIAEGPAAWIALEAVIGGVGRPNVRLAYMRRISTSGGAAEWVDIWGVRKHAADSNRFFGSIYEHHAEAPWERADVIFERLDDEAAE